MMSQSLHGGMKFSYIFVFGWSIIGCNDGRLKTYPVRGKAIFANGSVVKVGTIECKSREHRVQATGTIENDGTFLLSTYKSNDGAVAGLHDCVLVQFIQTENIPDYKPSSIGVVNKKHSTYSTSGLNIEVSASKPNEVAIKVEGTTPVKTSSDIEHQRSHDVQDKSGKSAK